MRIGAVVVVVWLIIGAFAAGQRGYYRNSPRNCANTGSTVVTIIAGPLNYLGINPKVTCQTPKPSS